MAAQVRGWLLDGTGNAAARAVRDREEMRVDNESEDTMNDTETPTLTAYETACALLERELEQAREEGRLHYAGWRTQMDYEPEWFAYVAPVRPEGGVEHFRADTSLAALTAACEYVRTLRKPLPSVESMELHERLAELSMRHWCPVQFFDGHYCGCKRGNQFIAYTGGAAWYLDELRTARALDGEA